MDTGDMIAHRIEALIASKGTNNRAVAISAGLGHTAVRDIISRKTKNPTYDTLLRIASVLNVPISEITGGDRSQVSIALAGNVGAGASVPLEDAYGKDGDGPHVECPPGLQGHGIVAVQVEGNSMEPVYFAGDVLFYSRPTHEGVPIEAIGRPCVCEDEDGLAWVKQVKAGSSPGLFHLIALNPSSLNQHDVRLKWAAPIKLHWPAELVRKI
ncbi:helix-turn-helix transcriptional regulator [Thioclava sp. BHET1]|nr:helix-turn-helix transcriptional regulator [Thioclava sp. BHET1]